MEGSELSIMILADGILDRLVQHPHRIEMQGDSMRKNRGEVNYIAFAPAMSCGLFS